MTVSQLEAHFKIALADLDRAESNASKADLLVADAIAHQRRAHKAYNDAEKFAADCSLVLEDERAKAKPRD